MFIPVTEGQLLLGHQASWYPLAAINQPRLLKLGEDFGDSLRLLRMMSAETKQGFYHIFSCPQDQCRPGDSPVPHVQVLHHPLIVNQACFGDDRGSGTGPLGAFLVGRVPDDAGQVDAFCTDNRKLWN